MTPARWSVLAGLAVALVLVGARTVGERSPAAARSVSHRTPSVAPNAPAPDSSAPSTDGARRVLVVGDSLVFNAAPQIGAVFEQHGVEARFVGHGETGPLSGQGWWAREVGYQVRAWHPDVVVVEACCNYMVDEPGYLLADGTTAAPDSPAMFDAWTAQVHDLRHEAEAGGAKVLWVLTPDAGPQWSVTYRDRVTHLNLIAGGLGVPLIDWLGVLEPSRTFTPTIPGLGGPVAVRTPDGLHLTDAGNQLVADATWRQVGFYLPAA